MLSGLILSLATSVFAAPTAALSLLTGTATPNLAVIDGMGAAITEAPANLATAQLENYLIHSAVVAPLAPANPSATGSTTMAKISLSWTASQGATAYNVYRAETAGGTYTKLTDTAITSTTYDDLTVTPGTTYYYVIKAQASIASSFTSKTELAVTAAESGNSQEVSAQSILVSAVAEWRSY